jgi:hypothetical protein
MKRTKLFLMFLVALSTALNGLPFQTGEAVFKLKVVAELGNVRQRPDIGSLIIVQLAQGTTVDASAKSGDWFKVSVKDSAGRLQDGYIHNSLVILLEEPRRGVEPAEVETEVLKPVTLKPPVQEVKKPPVTTEGKEPPVTPPKESEKETTDQKPVEGRIKAPSKPFVLPPVEFYLSGGGGLFPLGDLNTGAQGLGAFYADFLGVDPEGELGSLERLLVFGGDLTLPLGSRLCVGLGAEYFTGKKDGSLRYIHGLNETIYAARPEVNALPIRVFALYRLSSFFYARAGLEYYFTRCRYYYRLESEEYWQQWRGEAKAQGLGAMGGFGLVFDLTSALGIFLEVNGRYAKISGFEGTDHFEESSGQSATEKGKMYFYKAEVQGNKTFSLLYIRSRTPTEPGVGEPREATVDFSGLSLKAGLRIRF